MLLWVIEPRGAVVPPGTCHLQLWHLFHLLSCILSTAAKLKSTEPLPNVVCLGVQDTGHLCQQ